MDKKVRTVLRHTVEPGPLHCNMDMGQRSSPVVNRPVEVSTQVKAPAKQACLKCNTDMGQRYHTFE